MSCLRLQTDKCRQEMPRSKCGGTLCAGTVENLENKILVVVGSAASCITYAIDSQVFRTHCVVRLTAKTFLHAAHYYEVMSHFEGVGETYSARIKFSRKSGTDIMKAISTGAHMPGTVTTPTKGSTAAAAAPGMMPSFHHLPVVPMPGAFVSPIKMSSESKQVWFCEVNIIFSCPDSN